MELGDIEQAIYRFRTGRGMVLNDYKDSSYFYKVKYKGQAEYNEAFVKCIHELTGQKPQEEEEDEKYIIHYS